MPGRPAYSFAYQSSNAWYATGIADARGRHLGALPGRVGRVTGAIEAPAVRPRLDQHAIASRAGQPVSHAVLERVDIHSGAQAGGEGLPPRPLHDLGDREVVPLRVVPVEKSGGDPDLVGNPDGMPGFADSCPSYFVLLIFTM